ncbi:hypothetical protein EYF80_002113 [Liparis tanakae]|uniref:Uncharacterized protein n=1 Tax=Liparis tanakae TaxID=230148 RepID=A0A4Z2JC38_9TELE|nr:hypothetical protein EYF80_002113 [Liparis tanakae]
MVWFAAAGCAAAVKASLRGSWSPSHAHAAPVLEKLLDHGGVGQRGDVAQVLLVTGDFAEHPSHDLTCEWRRVIGCFSGDVWGPLKLSLPDKNTLMDPPPNQVVFTNLRAVVRHSISERYEAVEALSFHRMRSAHNRGLYDGLVLHQSRLHLRRTQ